MTAKLNRYFQNQEPYFNNIIKKQTAELIMQNGILTYYLRKTLSDRLDNLYGEDVLISFQNEAIDIEMYLVNSEEFEGQGDVNGMFGLTFNDSVTLEVASIRFEDEFKQFDMKIPEEGDLIFLPHLNSLFEIKYVDYDKESHFKNINPKFILKCDKFKYSNETFDVGIESIDKLDGNYTDTDGIEQVVEPDEMFDDGSINDALFNSFDDNVDQDLLTDQDDQVFDPRNPFGT